MFVDGDLYRDILIPGFEDKSFSFDEEVLDILEDKFVVAVILVDFWKCQWIADIGGALYVNEFFS